MDVKDVLAKNKAKIEKALKTLPARKPIEIATRDRPYSIEPEKVATNRQQTDNKPTTNRQQTSNEENGNWQQSGNKVASQPATLSATKWQQTDNKVATNGSFSELVGLQREIIIFICHECKNSRSRTTGSLTLEHIAKSLERNAGAVKTTLQRLEKKGCIHRVEFKNGRGGWSRYEVPDGIYHDALRSETDNKVATNRQQSGNKVASQPATEPATTLSSSSSNNIYIKKTTTSLPEEWNFDITPCARFGFGFAQIKQLAPLGVISSVDVEHSLFEFNYDFDNNTLPEIKSTAVNFLMGLFRDGIPYVSQAYQRKVQELKAQSAQNRLDREMLEIEAWVESLGEDEKHKLIDKMGLRLGHLFKFSGVGDAHVLAWLRNYYNENIKAPQSKS